MARDLVDVAPIRDAFLRTGLTAGDVASYAGWVRYDRAVPDGPRVQRALGLKKVDGGTFRARIQYETAVLLVRAMGVDPVDVGV